MRKEQFQRYKHYFFTYLRHITFVKLLNLIRTELKLSRNRPNLENIQPYFLFVEISNKCNLSCPLCQSGAGQTISRKNRMTLDNYIRFITPLKKHLFQVFLYDWGEPFLNRDIYDIISFNTRNNIATVVSTNFNLPADPARLVDSGLEYLIISGDGVTQDVYSKYRKGGDISKVFRNLENVVNLKKERRTRFPIIEWQCLVTKYNEDQLAAIKDTALSKGVDRVRFANLNFYSTDGTSALQEEWLPTDPQYRVFETNRNRQKIKRGIHKPCFWLWRGPVVNVNGGVTPCCLYDVPDWGNAFEDGLLKVWNNEMFLEARRRSQNEPLLKKRQLVCDSCTAPFIYK